MHVFLGGSCGTTTWRRDVAIPALEAANVPYFNPQVEVWDPSLVAIERKAKERAVLHLFVITGDTRAVAPMVEATELLIMRVPHDNLAEFFVALVVEDIPEGAQVDGEVVGAAERKDLNRGRAYLRDMAMAQHTPVFSNVAEATQALIGRAREIDLVREQYVLDAVQRKEITEHYPEAVWFHGDAVPVGQLVLFRADHDGHRRLGEIVGAHNPLPKRAHGDHCLTCRCDTVRVPIMRGWWLVRDLTRNKVGDKHYQLVPLDTPGSEPMITVEFPPALAPAPPGATP